MDCMSVRICNTCPRMLSTHAPSPCQSGASAHSIIAAIDTHCTSATMSDMQHPSHDLIRQTASQSLEHRTVHAPADS
eukprot:2312614-Rhodomonas_salina.9